MTDFIIGDLVKLKSGSPAMTVIKIFNNNTVKCSWFKDNEVSYQDFPVLSLDKITE